MAQALVTSSSCAACVQSRRSTPLLATGSGRAALGLGWGNWGTRVSCSRTGGSRRPMVRAVIDEKEQEVQEKKIPDVEATTRKWGLEAGLWQIFSSKDDGDGRPKEEKASQAKELLARYGGAYLATSISLSIVSFGLCYVLISSGVDIASLLEKVGIRSTETGEKVGTFALAYAAHKAASPIRFPPTVALTPIVASWFGKKAADVAADEEKKP